MLRSIRIAGIGPHTGTPLDIPPGPVEISGPSESGKSSITAAICALLWGTRTDGKPLPAGRSLTVEAETTKGTAIHRTRSASGSASMTMAGTVYDTQRDFTAALKALGHAEKLRPLLAPFGWVGLLQGPGEGRPLREWLVQHLPGESLESVLEGIRSGEADGKDHAARLKQAAAVVTRTNKGVARADGMLEEAQATEPEPPTAPDPARVVALQALAARHAEQTQAQADARAAVKLWDAATKVRRDSEDRHRRHEDALAQLVEPKAARVPGEALNAATEAKIKAADLEAAARRAKADVDAELGRVTREIEDLSAKVSRLHDVPEPAGCAGVAATKCSLARDRDSARERRNAEREALGPQIHGLMERAAVLRVQQGDAAEKVESTTAAATAARAEFVRLQDVTLKWAKYDEAAAKLGTAPTLAPDPGPRPAVPDVDPLPEDADAVLKHETALAFHRRDVENRATRIADLGMALAEARTQAARAAWVLETLRSAPGKVLGARLTALTLGPSALVLSDDGESIDWHIDGRPWGDASHGRQVVADAWVRRALADAAGAKWLPVIVDEVESVNGNQPLPGGLLWLLRSTPTAGLAVRALES